MILLTLPDVLAVAARVVACDSAAIVDRTDLDAVEQTLIEAKEVAGKQGADLAVVAATVLTGLVQLRPFHHPPFTTPERQIALVVTLQFLVLNDRDLDLAPIDEIDTLLNLIAAGSPVKRTAVALRIRLRVLGSESRTAHSSRKPRQAWQTTKDPWDSPEEKEPAMFERFTDRARRATVLAQEEARELHHNYIGTEHILLGLIHEGDGVAAKALEELNISLAAVRAQVLEIIGEGSQNPRGHIPFTPRAKKVMELSLREAMQLGHNYIGTEHILLGLIREGEGVAAQALVNLGVALVHARQKVVEVLARSGEEKSTGVGGPILDQDQLRRGIERFFNEKDMLAADYDRLATEVARLRNVLRRHGIDPDNGGEAERPAS